MLKCSSSLLLQAQQLQADIDRLQQQLQSVSGDVRQKADLIQGLQEQAGRLSVRDKEMSGRVDSLQQQLAASSAEVTRLTAELHTAIATHAQAAQVRS